MKLEMTDHGNQALLGLMAFEMKFCGLFDQNGTELTYTYYERQLVTWEYDSVTKYLRLSYVSGQDYAARIRVPVGTVKYIGFFTAVSEGNLLLRFDLEDDAVVFEAPDVLDVVDLFLEAIAEPI